MTYAETKSALEAKRAEIAALHKEMQALQADVCEIKLVDDGRYHYGKVTLG